MILRRFFLILAIIVLFPWQPAWAQATSSSITVGYYVYDAAIKKLTLRDSWEWTNQLRWDNMTVRMSTQYVADPKTVLGLNTTADMFMVTKRDSDGNIQQQVILQDGVMSSNLYVRNRSYYYDAQDFLSFLNSEVLRRVKEESVTPPNSSQPLMTIRTIRNDTRQPFAWDLYTIEEVLLYKSYLDGIPLLNNNTLRQNGTDYRGVGSYQMNVLTKKIPDFPNEIAIENKEIRATYVKINTSNYKDMIGVGDELRAQLAKYQETKKKSIPVVPSTNTK